MPPSATILLVAQNEPLLLSSARALHRAGYAVLVAREVAAAMAELQAAHAAFDLLVLDLQLPGASGSDFLEGAHIRMPVLYLADRQLDPATRDATQRLAPQMLLVPFDVSELLDRVKRLLSRSGLPPRRRRSSGLAPVAGRATRTARSSAAASPAAPPVGCRARGS